ncbi:hypothetical protein IEO21_05520 [Rhodonia placenta]|uniref:Uncharacterized protein n=1 Tax=Rhodonia placenta TaxID=104341 RepID=A0A8H7U1J5_9APHY|nr:hypothetical protein IEO21_05520 [Postia placenta]
MHPVSSPPVSARASSAPSAPYIPEPGHISAVYASVLIPFQALFDKGRPGSQEAEYSSLGYSGRRSRPCVVVDAAPGEAVTIFLMTTWNGVPLRNLPFVYEHFSVVVNQTADDDAAGVLHTTPRWHAEEKQIQYVIPLSVISDPPPHRRYMKGLVPYMVNTEQMLRAAFFQDDLMRLWNDLRAKKPGFQERQEHNWLVCLNTNGTMQITALLNGLRVEVYSMSSSML